MCIINATIRMNIGGCIIVVPYLEVTWCTLIRYSRFVFDDIFYLTRGATPKPSSHQLPPLKHPTAPVETCNRPESPTTLGPVS